MMRFRMGLSRLYSKNLMVASYLLFLAFLISRTSFLVSTLDDFSQLRSIGYFRSFIGDIDSPLISRDGIRKEHARILFPWVFRELTDLVPNPFAVYEVLRFSFVFIALCSSYWFASKFLDFEKSVLSTTLLSILFLIPYYPGAEHGDAINDLLDIVAICLVGVVSKNRKNITFLSVIALFLLQIFGALDKGEASLFLPVVFLVISIMNRSEKLKYQILVALLLFIVGFFLTAFVRDLNWHTNFQAIDPHTSISDRFFHGLSGIQGHHAGARVIGDALGLYEALWELLVDPLVRTLFHMPPPVFPNVIDEVFVSRTFGLYNLWFSYFWVFVPFLLLPTLSVLSLRGKVDFSIDTKVLIMLTWILLALSFPVTQMDEIRSIYFIFPFCAIIPFKVWDDLADTEGVAKL